MNAQDSRFFANQAVKGCLYLAATIGAGILVYPFAAPLILAAITASLFLKLKLLLPIFWRKQRTLFAALSTLVTLLLIIIPLLAIVVLLGLEAFGFVQFVQNVIQSQGFAAFAEKFNGLEDSLNTILGPLNAHISISALADAVSAHVETVGSLLYNNALGILSNTAAILVNVFFFLFITFFLVRDGEQIIENVKALMPFEKKDGQALVDAVEHVGQTVIVGSILSSMILGLIMTLVFFLFGFGSPILWGLCVALLSLVPVVGTWIIYIPSLIYLGLTQPWYVPVLFLACVILIDSFLFYAVIRPKFLDEKTHLYPLAIFLAIVGGLSWFGPIGLVYGPLIMTFFITLMRHVLLMRDRRLTKDVI